MSTSPPRTAGSNQYRQQYYAPNNPSYSSTAPAPSLRFSLTSRRRAQIAHGVKPVQRYDPAVVLSQRAQTQRSNAPPKFRRQVQRTDPFDLPPLIRWQHEMAENHWQPVDTHPAMHNATRYKTQQLLFSRPPPIFRTAPTLAERISSPPLNLSSGVSASQKDGPVFRPATGDPLLNYLESSWLENDLNGSTQNSEVTRTQRRFFDSPQRATQPPLFDQSKLEAKLLLEGLKEKTLRDRSNHGTRGRSILSQARKRERSPNLRDALAEHQQGVVAPEHVQAGFTAHPTHPERVLEQRHAPIPHNILAAVATDKHESLIYPPSPSYVYHPHSNFFRHIPNKNPRARIQSMKRERDWNERHQLSNAVEGW